MKKRMNPRGAENLANGIVRQAAEDYATAFMGGDIGNKTPEAAMKELNEFFHSEWYQLLTEVDCDWLMLHVKIRELEKVIEVYNETISISRNPFFKISISMPKGEDNINFTIPPRLVEDYMKVVRKQLAELKQELKDLHEKD